MCYYYGMNDRFVKIGEAAELLGVSVQALRHWESDGNDDGVLCQTLRQPES